MQLAKNVADIAPQLAAAAEADVDAYVDTVSKPELNNHVETVNKPEIDNYVDTVSKPEIDSYVDTVSKPELDNHVETVNKPEIDNYVDTVSKPEIDNYVETSAKPAVDNHVEAVAKPEIDNYANTVSKPAIDNYVDTVSKPAIDSYVDTVSKPAIDNYVDTSAKPEIDSYVDTSAKPEIDNHVETSAKPAIDNYLNTTVYPAIDAYWDNLANSTTLNADTLDGLHATDFVQQDSAGNVTINGSLEVMGDIYAHGKIAGLIFVPSIPPGSQAYFKKQLIDELAGITPDGYNTSTVTSYGLRTSSDNATLVVTERKDDVPFSGVTSFAVEEGTTNLFTNPMFQNSESGFDFVWGWSSRTIKDGGPLGRYIELVDSPSDGGSYGATFNVTPGQTYTFSVYINVLECQGRAVVLYYHWLDANGNVISGSPSDALGEEVPSNFIGQGWRRYKITDTAPEDAAKVRAFVYSSVAATSRIQVTGFQLEQKPFATSFTEGTRPHGIVKLTNPPLPLDNFVINLWFKATRYPTQNGKWWHLFDVSYNASAFQGLELVAPPIGREGIQSNTLSLTLRNSETTFIRYNLRFDLSAEVGKWHMITLISNGSIVDVYIDSEKRVSATNDIQRSAIEFIAFGRYFGNVSGTGMENGFLMANVLFASYDPAIWTDEYIRFLYEARKPFYM
jgi:hypothetical protein